MADGTILKLVFLRDASRERATPTRKAVVPLLDGVDFDLFVVRVRRRLGLPDGLDVTLCDEAGGRVTSIDALLEVDESCTLSVSYDTAAAAAATAAAAANGGTGGDSCACAASRRAGAAATTPRRGGGGSCAIDMPAAPGDDEGEQDEAGAGKYHKRRRPERVRRLVIGVASVGACGLIMLMLRAQ